MKKLLFVLMVALVSCKPFQYLTGADYEKSEFIAVEGSSKDQIFIKANEWMVNVFRDARSIIQFKDKDEGRIIGKYLLRPDLLCPGGQYGPTDCGLYAIINIYIKDDAAKISVEPQGIWVYDSSVAKLSNYSPEQANSDIDALIKDFKIFKTKEEAVW